MVNMERIILKSHFALVNALLKILRTHENNV